MRLWPKLTRPDPVPRIHTAEHRARASEIAREAFGNNLTATQTATEVSRELQIRYTKNSVIGLWHRLGLKRGQRPVIASEGQPTRKGPARNMARIPAYMPDEPMEPDENAPGVSILDLTLSSCRWPLWGDRARPNAHTSRYCGEPALTGRSYCACHRKTAKGTGNPYYE